MVQTKRNMGPAAYARRHETEGTTDANEATLPASKSLNDLKVDVPGRKKSASNTHAQRTTRSSTEKHNKIEHDSGFSSADRTSTVSGTKRSRSQGAAVQTMKEEFPPQHDEYEQSTERPESESDNVEGHGRSSEQFDVPNDPLKQAHLQTGNTQSARERLPGLSSRHPFAEQHVKGDSYPPTTEGEPSVADQPENLPPYSTHPPDNRTMQASGTLHARGSGASGTRVPLNASNRASHPSQQIQHPQADPAARNPTTPYVVPDFNNVMADANAAFSFAKAGGPRVHAPPQPPQHGLPPQSRQPPTVVAHRGSPPGTNLSSRQDGRQRVGQPNAQPVATEPQEQQRHLQKAPRRASTHAPPIHAAEQAPIQHQSAPPAQRHGLTSRTEQINGSLMVDNRKYHSNRESSYNEEPAEDEPDEEAADEADDEPDLYDYDEDFIFQMDYTQLKDEPFDVDPQADEFQMPKGQQQDTLQDKLQAITVLPGKVQSEFFQSLPAEQWEEAGDWFLDQFGDVLKKFKAARQSKRKAAMEFEDEIEKRHEAVSKKHKLTEDALGEMRKTGAVVLQGTPKKSKKSK